MSAWERQRDSVRIAAEIALKANSTATPEPGGVMMLPVEQWRRVNRMVDAVRRAATERPGTVQAPPHLKVQAPNLIRFRDVRRTS